MKTESNPDKNDQPKVLGSEPQAPEPPSELTTKSQLIHYEFPSAVLGHTRKILIYLPPGFQKTGPKCATVYIQDGQNVFDPRTAAFGVDWAMHRAADKAIAENRVRPLVIVAIYNSKQRFAEYTPTPDPRHKGGGAQQYLKFIIEELRPYIESTYNTSQASSDTCIMGSSLGGLLALYAGWRHPDKFGLVGSLSPSLWWGGRDLITAIGGAPDKADSPCKIYVDMGTRESNDDRNQNGVADVLDELRTLRAVLVYHGYRLGETLWYQEIQGAAHSESDWAARVGKVLEILLPANEAAPKGSRPHFPRTKQIFGLRSSDRAAIIRRILARPRLASVSNPRADCLRSPKAASFLERIFLCQLLPCPVSMNQRTF